MKYLAGVRTLFGWTTSPASEFLQMKAAAGAQPPVPTESANAPMLAALWKKDPQEVTWDEMQAAKIALVAVTPLDQLQAQFGSLLDEFETVTGGKPFAHGVFQNPPRTIDGWRAGVLNLLQELAKFRRARLMFERVRSTVGLSFGLPLLVVLLSGFVYVQVNYANQTSMSLPLWGPLLFTGLVGAGFSVLTRLYALAWSPRLTAQVEDTQALKKGLVINCILSLAEGVIAAAVLYLLFTSGLLKGSLFPEFKEPDGNWNSIFLRFLDYQPKEATDVSKLLVWAFIAGFSERFVPDKLNRLAGDAKEDRKRK